MNKEEETTQNEKKKGPDKFEKVPNKTSGHGNKIIVT